MDRFSFVTVLRAIIGGLGVTELLTNVARQIQSRDPSAAPFGRGAHRCLVFCSDDKLTRRDKTKRRGARLD
jgi:hypothetical protein